MTKTKKKIERPRISEKEIGAAYKMAARKKGVSRYELAEALGIKIPRASEVLERMRASNKGVEAYEAGPDAGKGSRKLIYFAKS